MATSVNGLKRQSALQDVYYAPGAHAQLVSLGKLEGQGWDVRLCEGGVEPRIWDGDPFTNVAKVNVPLRAALAACATCGTDSGDAAGLAPSPVHQDCGCVNRKWRDRYGDYGLDACAACIAAKAVHFPHKERYSCAGEYLGQEFTLTSPGQHR